MKAGRYHDLVKRIGCAPLAAQIFDGADLAVDFHEAVQRIKFLCRGVLRDLVGRRLADRRPLHDWRSMETNRATRFSSRSIAASITYRFFFVAGMTFLSTSPPATAVKRFTPSLSGLIHPNTPPIF